MKFFLFLVIFLSYVLIVELLPSGTTFLSCPNGEGLIDCSKVKCCPLHKTTCCLDESSFKSAVPMGCASVYPESHPLGCCGLKSCSEK